MDLSIIIVNWNSARYVASCVRSIFAETETLTFEVVVVDNASFDGCREHLASEFPEVIFVQSDHNVGFGGANNLGFQYAQGRTLLFLNPDTEVLDGAIDRLYEHLKNLNCCGVLGCRLLNADGSIQTSCVQALPTFWNQVLDANILRRCFPRAPLWGTRALLADSTVPIEVQAVSGACMMVPREVFEALEGFSLDFFMYGEDLDLCARATRLGFWNHHVGNCEIVHHGGGPSQHAPSTWSVVMMRHSVELFLRRSRGRVTSASYRVATGIVACARLAILALASPVWLIWPSARLWKGSWSKWVAILAWAIGAGRRARDVRYLQRRPSLPA